MTAQELQQTKEVKWSQWGPKEGMIRCGRTEYKTAMKWMQDLGKDAKECLKGQDKGHAIYGRKMHDDTGRITEIRFYCDTYLTDEELDVVARANPMDTLYVAHK